MNTNHTVIEKVNGIGGHYYLVQMGDGSFYKSYSTENIRTTNDEYHAARIADKEKADGMVIFLTTFFDDGGVAL